METPRGPESFENHGKLDIQALVLYIVLLVSAVLPLNAVASQGEKINEIRQRIQAELCDKRKCNIQFIVSFFNINDPKLQKLIIKKLEGLIGESIGDDNIVREQITRASELNKKDTSGNTWLTLDNILNSCMENPEIDAVSKARLLDMTNRISVLTENMSDISFYIKAYKKGNYYDLRMVAISVINEQSVSLDKPLDIDRLLEGTPLTKQAKPYEVAFSESVIELLAALLNIAEVQKDDQAVSQKLPAPKKLPTQPKELKVAQTPVPTSKPTPPAPKPKPEPKPTQRSYGLRLTAEGAFVPKDGKPPKFNPRFEAGIGGVVPFNQNHGLVADLNYGIERGLNHFLTLSAGYRLSLGHLHLEFAPEGLLRISESDEGDGGFGIKGRILYELPVAKGKIHIIFSATGNYIYIPDNNRHIAGGTIGGGILFPLKQLKK